MPEQLLVTVEEAGKMIRVGRTRMYELVASGTIPSVRIGRSVRVPVDTLREWIAGELAAEDSSAAEPHSGAGIRIGGGDGERQPRGTRSA